GLAASMMALEAPGSGDHVELMIEIGVGIDEFFGPLRWHAELPRVDDAVVAGGAPVTIETRGDRAMADDARPRTAMLLRLGGERRHPSRMIDVTVGVDGGVDALGRPSAHHRNRLGLVVMPAGVDQHQAVLSLDRGEIRKPSPEHHARGDFLRLAGRGQRMTLADRKLAV